MQQRMHSGFGHSLPAIARHIQPITTYLSLHMYQYTVQGHYLDFAAFTSENPSRQKPLLAVTLKNNHRSNTTHMCVCAYLLQFRLHQEHCLQFADCILQTQSCTNHVQI